MSEEKKRLFLDQRYKFTAEELAKLSEQLVQLEMRMAELMQTRADTVADFTRDLKALKSEINTIVRKLYDRSEMRQVEVMWAFDEPERGMKSYLNVETNRIIEGTAEPMSFEERQQGFAFNEPEEGEQA